PARAKPEAASRFARGTGEPPVPRKFLRHKRQCIASCIIAILNFSTMLKQIITRVSALVIAILLTTTGYTQSPNYDVLITNARIVDGTGAPWYVGHIGIRGDRIAAMGDLHDATATQQMDAARLVASPGFIDLQGQSEFNILVDGRAASKITQGVTTEITGEGNSIAPLNDLLLNDRRAKAQKYGVALDWRSLDEYFQHFERTRSAINLGTFIGAGGLRAYVMGKDDRPASPEELEQMRKLLADGMRQGAFGLSSALQYVPGRFASTDELIELAKVARSYGGVYFTHQRSEADRISPSLDEVFTIADHAKISTTIWHLKTSYPENFGKMLDILGKIEAARARGLDVAATVYPYIRAANDLIACFPTWLLEGGTDKMIERLKDPAQRKRAKEEMDK